MNIPDEKDKQPHLSKQDLSKLVCFSILLDLPIIYCIILLLVLYLLL